MTGLTPIPFRKGRERAPRLSPVRVPGRHAERFWRPEEEAVLRQSYPTGGVEACAAGLARLETPKRSLQQIYARANKLGLRSTRQKSGPRRSYKDLRTPEMDERIRAGWANLKGRGAVRRFAEELGIPRTELSRRALNLGLSMPHKKEPPWTAAEESLLKALPLNDLHRASAVMREHGFHRTPTAIGIRATRRSISRCRSDVLSGTGAAKLLGIDGKTVTGWCIDGSLPASRRGTERLPQQGGDTWTIRPADLRRFVIDNLDRIDLRRVEKFGFVDLLVGTGKSASAVHAPGVAAAPIVSAATDIPSRADAATLTPAPAPTAAASPRPGRAASGVRGRPPGGARRPLAEILAEAELTHAARTAGRAHHRGSLS